MLYINARPGPGGAYGGPQDSPFEGSVALTEEQAALLVEYGGFVTVETSENGTTVTPNQAAWEAWQAAHPPVTPGPTAEEDAAALLIDHEYRLTLLELGVTEEG